MCLSTESLQAHVPSHCLYSAVLLMNRQGCINEPLFCSISHHITYEGLTALWYYKVLIEAVNLHVWSAHLAFLRFRHCSYWKCVSFQSTFCSCNRSSHQMPWLGTWGCLLCTVMSNRRSHSLSKNGLKWPLAEITIQPKVVNRRISSSWPHLFWSAYQGVWWWH